MLWCGTTHILRAGFTEFQTSRRNLFPPEAWHLDRRVEVERTGVAVAVGVGDDLLRPGRRHAPFSPALRTDFFRPKPETSHAITRPLPRPAKILLCLLNLDLAPHLRNT